MSDDVVIRVDKLGKKYCIRHSPTRSAEAGPEWTVYGIKNTLGRVYIGQTGDLNTRLRAHNTGLVRSTRSDGPWYLIARENCQTQSEARWLEFQLKSSRGRRKKWLETRNLDNE